MAHQSMQIQNDQHEQPGTFSMYRFTSIATHRNWPCQMRLHCSQAAAWQSHSSPYGPIMPRQHLCLDNCRVCCLANMPSDPLQRTLFMAQGSLQVTPRAASAGCCCGRSRRCAEAPMQALSRPSLTPPAPPSQRLPQPPHSLARPPSPQIWPLPTLRRPPGLISGWQPLGPPRR